MDKAASHVSMLSDKNFKVALIFNLDVLRVFQAASLQYQQKFTTLIGMVFESAYPYGYQNQVLDFVWLDTIGSFKSILSNNRFQTMKAQEGVFLEYFGSQE